MDHNTRYDFEIKANMTLTDYLSSDLVATGTVTIDNFFAIHNVKVLQLGKEGEKKLQVVLPNRQNAKTGKWENVFTLSGHVREQIDKAVIYDLTAKMRSSVSQVADYLQVDVFLSRKEFWPTVGYATVKLPDVFEVNKVRIMDDQNGGLQVKYPFTKSGAGKYIKLFGGVCEEHERRMSSVIISEFQTVYKRERREYYEPKQFPQEAGTPASADAPAQNHQEAPVNQNYEKSEGGVKL